MLFIQLCSDQQCSKSCLSLLEVDFAALERSAVENSLKWRSFSNLPENTVYSGPTASAGKRVTLRTLRQKYEKKEPLSMVTAYDYPSAVHVGGASPSKKV